MYKIVEPENRTTEYRYDGNGNKTEEITPLGHHIAFSYDGNSRLTGAVRPVDVTTTTATAYSYDLAGDKLSETDGGATGQPMRMILTSAWLTGAWHPTQPDLMEKIRIFAHSAPRRKPALATGPTF